MKGPKILFLAALFLGSASLPAFCREGGTGREALSLIPASSWEVVRLPGFPVLGKLMEKHPLWRLYCRGGERRALWKALGRFLVEKQKERLGGDPRVGEWARFAGELLRREENVFLGEAAPSRIWGALTSLTVRGLSWDGEAASRQEEAAFPGFLILLEYGKGEEEKARGAEAILEGAFRDAAKKMGKMAKLREIVYHGRAFRAFGLETRGVSLDLWVQGRFGRFLAVSLLSPWPLFQAAQAWEGRASSLEGKPLGRALLEVPAGRAAFLVHPDLFPWALVPQPIPLAWRELGLPRVRWVLGWWDPASGRKEIRIRSDRPVGGPLARLAGETDPDELARLLPADTAAFGLVPLDWMALAPSLEPLLREARVQGLLPGDVPVDDLVSGFRNLPLSRSPLPVLSGLKALGLAVRIHEGLPMPDVAAAFRLTPEFARRARDFVEDQLRKRKDVRVTRLRDLSIYRGPWLYGSAFVFKGEWVLLSPNPGMLRGFLPVLRGKAPSLAARKSYRDLRAALPAGPSLGFFYVDLPGSLRALEHYGALFLSVASMKTGMPSLAGLLHGDEGFPGIPPAVGGGIFLDEKGVLLRNDLPFSPLDLWAFGARGGLALAKEFFDSFR